MASSFYINSQHIVFDSVLSMDDPGMVSMFQALMASGLVGFLGCPTVIYEAALVDFFENASVREGVIFSTVAGQLVEISEEWFAESFDLPVDGLSALSEIPKDKIFYARSIVSLLGEPISLLLENIPNLELGESSEFPASKILTEKTVHRYVSLNDKGGAKEAADAPLVKKAPKKRPAAADFEAPVVKKKRTMKKKSGSSKAFLEIVAVAEEAVPIQMVEPTTTEPAAEDEISADPPADEVAGENADVEAADEGSNEEPAAGDATRINEPTTEPTVTEFVNEESSTADDVDIIIEQVLADTAQISVDEGEQVVCTLGEGNQPAGTAKEPHWFDLPYDDLIVSWDAERPVVTASDTDEEEGTMDVGAAGGDQQVQFYVEEPEGMEMSDELIDADEKMSLEDILMTIPVDVQLPSADIEITKITMGKEIKIPGVDEKTQYLDSFPKIPVDNKGKAILVEKDPVKGNPAREHYSLICADIDLLVQLRAQVIDADDQFFHSFSFKKLATINIEELSKKEEQVLCWGETETTHVALNRKRYILLKYREVLVRKFLESWKNNFVPGKGSSAIDLKVIDMLSDLHLFVLEELREQALAHGLKWTRTCCSKIVEVSPRDRGAIIARTKTNTPSTCCLRTMIRVDGVWVVEPFCDQWVKIPWPVQKVSIQVGAAALDTVDVRREVKAVNAKVDILSSRLDDVKKDVEATKEAISHQLLEFQSQAQANHIVLTDQLGQLVDYINRGGNAKKGEGERSRGPQPPPAVQIRDSGIAGGSGDAVRTTEISQADVDAANRQILERMMREDREREKERRIHYIRGRFTAFAQIWKDAKFVLTFCDLPLGGAGFTAYELAEIQKEILLPLKKLMTVEIEDYK
ncbi:hypothetical protein F511_17422 [Dorcoceras hygrometricum]|uniref:Dystroglycan-like n=1 Tax=Dorcoceras hygrometricum TaxID=472368 RepID=A0A2Z7C4R6_9LAMI|nr:hypothetical protein F511_17422 [Dorcoceras hygrometricum]